MFQALMEDAALTSRAFIFPGQGSQDVGMGRALAEQFPAARAVFDEVDEALRGVYQEASDKLGREFPYPADQDGSASATE